MLDSHAGIGRLILEERCFSHLPSHQSCPKDLARCKKNEAMQASLFIYLLIYLFTYFFSTAAFLFSYSSALGVSLGAGSLLGLQMSLWILLGPHIALV